MSATTAGCVQMSYNEIPILQRAFELARTGAFRRVKDLEKALAAAGYARNDPQLHSPSVRKQLRRLCRATASEVGTSLDAIVAAEGDGATAGEGIAVLAHQQGGS